MQYFLLPVGLCNELQAMISQFWWVNINNERRTSYCSWAQLCRPKEEGELGFRDFEAFNKALLAKQGWWILQNPESMVARLLKARYFPWSSFLDAAIGSVPSFTWQSIVAGRDILTQGLQWQIGDGTKARIWLDPWIPLPLTFKVVPPQ